LLLQTCSNSTFVFLPQDDADTTGSYSTSPPNCGADTDNAFCELFKRVEESREGREVGEEKSTK